LLSKTWIHINCEVPLFKNLEYRKAFLKPLLSVSEIRRQILPHDYFMISLNGFTSQMEFHQLVAMSRVQESSALRPNSRMVYDSYLRSYENKMSEIGEEPYPITEDKMRGFIMYLKVGQPKPACLNTMKLHVATFANYFSREEQPDLTKGSRFKTFMRAVRLELGETAPNARSPVGPEILTKLVEYVFQVGEYRATFLFAMITLMYYGFLRFSEAANLRQSDVQEEEGGIMITIRQSKTDPFAKGTICFIQESDTPYSACEWLRRARTRRYQRHDPIFPISLKTFNKRFRNLLADAGVEDIATYSSHSLRRGGAQQAAKMGVQDNVIQRHGRWKSTAFMRYTVLERRTAGIMITSKI
jgi:integrase